MKKKISFSLLVIVGLIISYTSVPVYGQLYTPTVGGSSGSMTNVGIGITMPQNLFSIQQSAITGNAEYPFLLSVSDASTTDFFSINNNSTTDNVFVPAMWGHRESGYSNECISIIGSTTTTNDMGSVPIMIFDSRIYPSLSGSTESVPAPSPIGTRPLFDWASGGSSKMRMLANGNLGIGTTTPGYLLDVNGTVNMTGFKLGTSATSGYVLTSDGAGNGTWQPAATGNITGAGVTNYIPLFTSSSALTTSNLYQSGSKIGVGTSSPVATFEVDGTSESDITYIRDHSGNLQFMLGSEGTTMIGNNSVYGVDGVGVLEVDQYSESLFACYLRSNAGSGRGLRIKGGYYNDTMPLLQIEANNPTGMGYNTIGNERMVVLANGAVGIGTNMRNNPNNYLLAVNGSIGASGTVVVENTSGTWPDYVFEKSYKIMSLADLDKYISQNKHLPGVQSAEEVKKTGLDVTKTDEAILKNLEELSLHLIELQKENDALKARIAALESK